MTDAAWTEPRDATHAVRSRAPERTGFTLSFAGLLAMLLGVGAFLYAQSIPPSSMTRYHWREVAGASVGLALPLFLLGIVRALPGRRWTRALAYAGVAAAALGVGAFVALYPYMWNVRGRDYSPWGIVPYAVGVTLLATGGFAGLLDAYLERRAGRASVADDGGPVTEAEVMRDIEEQTKRQRLTWGGVLASAGPAITIQMGGAPLVAAGTGVGRAFILDDMDTAPDATRLLAFRGATRVHAEAMESQADALVRLREDRAAGDAARPAWRRAWSRIAAAFGRISQ